MRTGDLVRIVATGCIGIITDPYAENQPVNGFVCKILTSNTGFMYMYWDELEKIHC